MPPRRRAPAQTLSARIESTDEGSGGVEVLPKKAPVKRSTRRSATASVTVETAAAAVDKGEKKLTATAGGGGRKKKAAVNRVEEPTEDEDAPGDVGEEEGGEDDEEDVLEAAPVKSRSKVSTAAGKKATTAAAAAVKSKPKRGAKKVEVEIEGDDEEREATEEEKEVPAPVKKRGGRKAVPVEAAIPVVVAAAPVAEKKKRMTKKEKDAAAAAAKKAEAEEQGKEREIAETQYTPMQLDKDAVDGADDLMEVEATPTQAHSAPTVASKKAAAAGKKAGASKARGRAAKITEPEVVEEGEDDDDLALPAKPPIPVPPRRAGRRVAGNEVVLVAAGAGADTETEAYKSLEKAFHELETRHKKLEYVRETEAEQTFARYKQNAEIRAKEANKLIDSLQTDLNAQALLSSESKTLKKKLTSKEAEVAKLQSKVQELQRGLQEQQNEAKVLSAKLIVAENNSKRGAVAIPGSAVKPKGGIGGGGGGMVGAGQAAEEAWIAKVKEELFQDLTGLLVMNVKKEGKRTVFECLQTSSTGVTIHFKLRVLDPLSTASSSSNSRHQRKPSAAPDSEPTVDEDEEGKDEVIYFPLLDKQRDKAVIALLPDYLGLEIGFKREQMSDFFAKITAFMMNMKAKRILGDEEEGDEEEGDEEEGDEEEEEEEDGDDEEDEDEDEEEAGEGKGNEGDDGDYDEKVGDA